MKTLTWHGSTGAELAELLIQAKLEESAAVSGATVYRLMHGGVEKIAISLSDGQVLIIQPEGVNQPRRRRLEPQAPDGDEILLTENFSNESNRREHVFTRNARV